MACTCYGAQNLVSARDRRQRDRLIDPSSKRIIANAKAINDGGHRRLARSRRDEQACSNAKESIPSEPSLDTRSGPDGKPRPMGTQLRCITSVSPEQVVDRVYVPELRPYDLCQAAAKRRSAKRSTLFGASRGDAIEFRRQKTRPNVLTRARIVGPIRASAFRPDYTPEDANTRRRRLSPAAGDEKMCFARATGWPPFKKSSR